MVVARLLLRLWLLFFRAGVFGPVLAQGPQTHCYKFASQPTVPEIQGWKSGSHRRDGTTSFSCRRFQTRGVLVTMLGNEYYSMVYHGVFLAWYARRDVGEFQSWVRPPWLARDEKKLMKPRNRNEETPIP